MSREEKVSTEIEGVNKRYGLMRQLTQLVLDTSADLGIQFNFTMEAGGTRYSQKLPEITDITGVNPTTDDEKKLLSAIDSYQANQAVSSESGVDKLTFLMKLVEAVESVAGEMNISLSLCFGSGK